MPVALNKTDTSQYTTQFLLLFAQLVYDSCITELTLANFRSIASRLSKQVLVNPSAKQYASFGLTAREALDLYYAMLEENGIDPSDLDSDKDSGKRAKKPPSFSTELCEVYYYRRISELQSNINSNKAVFKEQLQRLEEL